ncbi:hypothetical protein MES4922_550012 [Mesorhizobium ventifaucium]|uniref:Uncharacterized protein n=1 Tax=Mesorhizobium ventifaucium TaxID=666020 RepID=A0ABM9ED95_9HYPH|nr:hypothetical protein MES4922_550012 [Mesorhizobium ventifaucium]
MLNLTSPVRSERRHLTAHLVVECAPLQVGLLGSWTRLGLIGREDLSELDAFEAGGTLVSVAVRINLMWSSNRGRDVKMRWPGTRLCSKVPCVLRPGRNP